MVKFKIGDKVQLIGSSDKGVVARSGQRSQRQKKLVFVWWDEGTESFEPKESLVVL